MKNISLFDNIYIWIRSQPLLYRFTLGTRILLALAFIPTGLVKVLGRRFATNLDTTDGGVGAFFEILYSSGIYWQFLGLSQMVAGFLILWRKTSAIGSIMFLAIILNIFFITISYDFKGTWVITTLLVLAASWLCIWDWNKIRYLVDAKDRTAFQLPEIILQKGLEQGVYLVGFIAGLLFFSMIRGLGLWMPKTVTIILICLISACFMVALGLGIKNRAKNNSQKP
jgi:hypothetical protein